VLDWRTFLQFHATEFAALDFFVVPTAELKVLVVLVILGHDRQQLLHFALAKRLRRAADWTARQSLLSCGIDDQPRNLTETATQLSRKLFGGG
jgi:hypothetical protein